MDSSSIELPGCEIEGISLSDDQLTIRFARAYIVKTMTGSVERTLWWQAGELVIDGIADPPPDRLPEGPLVCAGGDVGENVYTYRDMLPIPLESRGRVFCKLRFRGIDQPLIAHGSRIRLTLHEVPRYIRHIRPG
jgi:hypothetical protein